MLRSRAVVRMTSDDLFEDVEDGLPIGARTSHYRVRTTFVLEPQPQPFEIFVKGSKRAVPYVRFWVGRTGHDAHNNKGLANVNAGTPLNHCLDHELSPCAREKPAPQVVACSTGSTAPIGGSHAPARSIFLVGVIPSDANYGLFSLVQ